MKDETAFIDGAFILHPSSFILPSREINLAHHENRTNISYELTGAIRDRWPFAGVVRSAVKSVVKTT
jgi:hypothetical protein